MNVSAPTGSRIVVWRWPERLILRRKLASLLDPGTKCKRTFLGEEGIAGEKLVSESDQMLGHPTFKVTHDSDDRIETKWYFSEPRYGCAVAKMVMQFKDPQKPGAFASVSSQEVTSVGPAPPPEVFNADGYHESDPREFAEEFAFARITINKQIPQETARANARKKAGTNPDVAEWVERYKVGRPTFK